MVTSDLYAIGVILFEMLTGRTPFAGASLAELATLVASKEPPSPRLLAPACCGDLGPISSKCLERDPSKRYASAEALAEDLRRFLDGEPIIAARCRRWAAFSGGAGASPLLPRSGFSCWPSHWAQPLRPPSSGTNKSGRKRSRANAGPEAQARERLREAKLSEAAAIRRTTIPGRRERALGALAEAARLRPGDDLRDEALAALLLIDVKLVEKWSLKLGVPSELNIDGTGGVATSENRDVADLSLEPAALWKWGAAKPFLTLSTPGAHAVGQMHFSPDGKLMMQRFSDDTLRIWRVGERQPLCSVPNRPAPGGHLTSGGYSAETFNGDYDFTPDGASFALGLPGGGVSLHRVADGLETARWAGGELINTLAISPNGRFLAAAHLLDNTGKLVYVLALPDLRPVSRSPPPVARECSRGPPIRGFWRSCSIRATLPITTCATAGCCRVFPTTIRPPNSFPRPGQSIGGAHQYHPALPECHPGPRGINL